MRLTIVLALALTGCAAALPAVSAQPLASPDVHSGRMLKPAQDFDTARKACAHDAALQAESWLEASKNVDVWQMSGGLLALLTSSLSGALAITSAELKETDSSKEKLDLATALTSGIGALVVGVLVNIPSVFRMESVRDTYRARYEVYRSAVHVAGERFRTISDGITEARTDRPNAFRDEPYVQQIQNLTRDLHLRCQAPSTAEY